MKELVGEAGPFFCERIHTNTPISQLAKSYIHQHNADTGCHLEDKLGVIVD